MSATAESLLKYTTYTTATGDNAQIRDDDSNQEWLIRAVSGELYEIKFSKNFSKKHLFRSTKKDAAVENRAQVLAGGGAVTSQHLADARSQLDEAKLMKQATHRTKSEIATCINTNCGHTFHDHYARHAGGVCVKCGCARFQSRYEEKRSNANKPILNPLQGMPTNRSTYIDMSRAARSIFEKAVTDGVSGQMAGWAVGSEKVVDWDFGHSGQLPVVTVCQNPSIPPTYAKGVKVKVKRIGSATTNVFEVFHFDGTIP